MRSVVIGAGMGGLAAAITLARAGDDVVLLEARDRVGGLAGGIDLAVDGTTRTYDGGPYILLDRPGLEWALTELGVDLGPLRFLPLEEPWRVHRPDGPSVSVFGDLERTVDALEADHPGAGVRYRDFVQRMTRVYDALVPLQRGHASPWALIRHGALRHAPFLLRGLGHHLARTGLPPHVVDALGIWTHIAGQPLAAAPAPLAFVPAIVHSRGAFTVEGGIHRIPERMADHARALGVDLRLGTRVERIVRDGRRILGVDLADGRLLADRVVSGAAGVGTYVRLLEPPDPALSARLQQLPLQSPGVAAYLHAPDARAPFLQFQLPPGELCRVLIHPGAVDATRRGHARLLAPTDHGWATQAGPEGQRAYLDRLLAEPWWQGDVPQHEVLATRIPQDWGRRYHLYRESMNPVMTARFMRQGRLPHRSPIADNLYLAGSSTHPGQWVSFCAISGLLAGRAALSDSRRARS